MTPCTAQGRYVRVDPLDLDRDVDLLWQALGGDVDAIQNRIQWWGLSRLETLTDLQNLLVSLDHRTNGWCVNVFRVLPPASSASSSTSPTNHNDKDSLPGQVAGMASYITTNPDHGTTEVGYVVHGPAMAQSPASTEAHYLLAQHALDTMAYRRLEWKCNSQNQASGRAALRYGYTYEGCFRQHRVTAQGQNRDTNWYSLLDGEWPQVQRAMETWLHPHNFHNPADGENDRDENDETKQRHKKIPQQKERLETIRERIVKEMKETLPS
eukprot:CAMPEP_0172475510 /NCGR_PEP_ID=MMETSP1065-20121228/69907_1 /TAXON_ID=265537 /ORGANISM="Amphiprora paludosa, Strain CCMP125" /LENGTH=267 /DNA_ID=CAMNT_0013233715 /DNA_START=25 /DNA_END=828 /DNA_ORIENTATION=+